MSEFFIGYEKIAPATWVYLSSLLMLALYFKFNRYWSLRNLDLILLIAAAPGLLFYHWGSQLQTETLREVAARTATNDAPVEPPIAADDSSDLEPPSVVIAATDEVNPSASPPPSVGSKETRLEIEVGDGAFESAVVGPEEASRRALARSRTLLTVGYVWLFAATALFFVRLVIDPLMVRRPLLDPNLTPGGLVFLGCSLFIFLMANVLSSPPSEDDLQGPQMASALFHRQATEPQDESQKFGPGLAVVYLLPTIPSYPTESDDDPASPLRRYRAQAIAARIMAFLSHLAIVAGIVAIGWRHFNNLTTAVGMAALYLMLPYTAIMTGRVIHFLPAAMLVWAFVFYRRPMISGAMMGLAIGTIYYPLYLLPLWISFYRQRGWWKFLIGVGASLAVVVVSLIFTSADPGDFLWQLRRMFGLWAPQLEGLEGFWDLVLPPAYRISALTAFVAISGALALWPTQKNLGTLISYSALVMVAVQFWHGFGGGTYMAWYLPLMILTFFRPNLEDRVALSVIRGSKAATRRAAAEAEQLAA